MTAPIRGRSTAGGRGQSERGAREPRPEVGLARGFDSSCGRMAAAKLPARHRLVHPDRIIAQRVNPTDSRIPGESSARSSCAGTSSETRPLPLSRPSCRAGTACRRPVPRERKHVGSLRSSCKKSENRALYTRDSPGKTACRLVQRPPCTAAAEQVGDACRDKFPEEVESIRSQSLGGRFGN